MSELNDPTGDQRPVTGEDRVAEPSEFETTQFDTSAEADAVPQGDDETLIDATPEVAPEQSAEAVAEEQLLRLFQSTVFGENNEKIGRVGQVYLDDQTQDPNWVTVKTGLFGTKEFFVPLDEARYEAKQIHVPYAKDVVTSSPRTEIDQNLSPAEEDDLYNHYRVPGRMTVAEDAPAPLGMPVTDAVPADEVPADEVPAGDVLPEEVLADEPIADEPIVVDEVAVEPADEDRAPGFFEGFSDTEAPAYGEFDAPSEPVAADAAAATDDTAAFAPPVEQQVEQPQESDDDLGLDYDITDERFNDPERRN